MAAHLLAAHGEDNVRRTGDQHPGIAIDVLQGKEYVSISTEGLYPIGEGAGYAGGIMSAALDGLNAALAVIRKYKSF